jgi:dUTP pyrophosphatase
MGQSKIELKKSMEQVKIKLNGGIMPTKGSEFAAAYDLYVPENIELKYGRQVIDLKFSIELPHGYAAIIQPRSGFTCKGMQVQAMIRHWWFMLLGVFSKEKRVDADVIVGLVDEDYRDSVGALVKSNHLPIFRKAIILKGTRIAQMRIVQVPQSELLEVEELDMTKNRGGGYGHTGVK